jgi:putative ABC transport system permease protein
MNLLRQIFTVSGLNFRNLPRRAWQSLVVVTGMALVIAVLLAMLSMTVGLRQASGSVGDPGLVLAVTKNVNWEGASSVPRDQARVVMDAPGIAHASDGTLLADPQIYTQAPVVLRANGGRQQIALRGLGPKGLTLRPELRIVSGRMFRPGGRELIVGVGAPRRFRGVAVGDKIILPDGEWPIVGSFATGDLQESMLMGDADTLMAATRKPNYTSVLIRLAPHTSLDGFARALNADPRLKLDVMRQREWYQKANLDFFNFLDVMIYAVAMILAVGALFGCVNVMYASVEARSNEIATLRAIGFGGFAVAFSVILEAALLSLTGALIGAAFVWWRYDGVETGFAVNVFKLTVSPAMIATAMLWAVAVALLGGILPSFRAARLNVSDALRAT